MENISKNAFRRDGCNPVDFYDMTIDIPSLSSMTKNDESPYGWDVQFSEKGLQKYQNLKKSNNSVVVGIIGNRNSGKSYILSKIIKYELPRGPNVKTKSISAILPDNNGKILFLEAVGLNNPIMNDKENTKSMKDNSQQKEIRKDQLLTDSFLISFLLQYSNILIICVENLTFSQKKLLQKIRDLEGSKQLEQKIRQLKSRHTIILVVHNLYYLSSKKEVEEYIHNVLKKSANFGVEEINKSVFAEFNHRNSAKIIHLVLASEGTEAGNYYNQATFNYIRNYIEPITKRRIFDIIEELMNYYSIKSHDYMEKGIGREEIKYDESLGKIYVDNHKQIILREPFKFVKSNYEYEYEFLGDDKMKLKIYLPGGKLNNKINYIHIQYDDYDEDNIIIIEVEKKLPDFVKIRNDNLSFSNIKHGNFKIILKLPANKIKRFNYEKLRFDDMNDDNIKWGKEEKIGQIKETDIFNITFLFWKFICKTEIRLVDNSAPIIFKK